MSLGDPGGWASFSAFAASLACVFPIAQAQVAYPGKPVTFIVPFPPGGGTDIAARIGLMDRAARTRRGTPAAIVDRVAADARVVLAAADTRDRLISQGAVPQAGTPAHLQALIDADSARYGRIIREKGLKVQ